MRSALNPKTVLGSIALAAGLVFGGGLAHAQVDTYEETPPQVLDDQDEVAPEQGADEVVPTQVAGDDVAADTRGIGGLPVTGGDLLALAAIGAGAVTSGGVVLLYRRSRTV